MAHYAPGIYRKGYKGNIEELPTDVVLTLAQQLHDAKRAGRHTDIRIGTPSGLYSFASRKGLPQEPGEKRLLVPTELHDYNYRTFSGDIKSGYGAGHVEAIEDSPVVLLKNTPNHIIFTRGTSQDSPIYSMVRTANGNWICTIRQEGQPTAVISYKKEHFKRMPLDQVADVIDRGARIKGKIDGASSLVYLGDKGIRVFGTRVGASGKRPEYSDYIGGLRGFKVPDELQGKLLRGELYGVGPSGKPIHPNELSAILHSNLVNAIDKKQKGGIRLLIAALAENKNGVDDYWTGADDIVAKLNHPAIHGLPPATGDEAKRLVEQIRTGKYPLTREGIVAYPQHGRPIKSKKIDDYDVVIRDIFKADTNRGDMAGGFAYSYPDSDKVIGRVGTGFNDAMRKDMWKNPANYIGALARVHSQEQLSGSKALRAPSFIALKAD